MILWSGGVDSTLLLVDALLEERRRSQIGERTWPTRTLSVNWQDVPQNDEQIAARKKLRKIIAAKFGLWRHLEATMTFDGTISHGMTYGGVGQPQLWIASALHALGKTEPFVVGYHDGDRAWAYLTEITDALRILGSMSGRANPLETPLRRVRKAYIIERLRAHGAEIYEATFWCENPKRTTRPKASTACGDCAPCRTHLLAIDELRRFPNPVSYL